MPSYPTSSHPTSLTLSKKAVKPHMPGMGDTEQQVVLQGVMQPTQQRARAPPKKSAMASPKSVGKSNGKRKRAASASSKSAEGAAPHHQKKGRKRSNPTADAGSVAPHGRSQPSPDPVASHSGHGTFPSSAAVSPTSAASSDPLLVRHMLRLHLPAVPLVAFVCPDQAGP
jgi:hypothetical protein